MKSIYSLLLLSFVVVSCSQPTKTTLVPNNTTNSTIPASFYVLKNINAPQAQPCGCDHDTLSSRKGMVSAAVDIANCLNVKDAVSTCEPDGLYGKRLQVKN